MHVGIPSVKVTLTVPWVRPDFASEVKKYFARIIEGRPVGSCATST